MFRLLQKNWFLLTLVALLLTGYLLCQPLEWVLRFEWLKWVIVMATMFIMAWPISFSHMQSTLLKPAAPALATGLNVGLLPLMAWPIANWCGPELGPGLLIAAATPSTLASAAVWTRRAMGNDGVAIMVTILTNASCFLVMPFWIYWQTGSEIETSKLTDTIYKLLFFVVLPIGAGQLARLHPASAAWATRQKPILSTVAMAGILSIVFLGAIKMGLRFSHAETGSTSGLSPLSAGYLLITVAAVFSLHVATFWLGYGLGGWLGLPRADQIAVSFSGSQKTLMIGLSTAVSLGFSMIPIVLFHTIQLLIDTVFAEKIRSWELARTRRPKGSSS